MKSTQPKLVSVTVKYPSTVRKVERGLEIREWICAGWGAQHDRDFNAGKNIHCLGHQVRGRAFDNIFLERLWRNVKYEDVYLNGYPKMGDLLMGLTNYFDLYNNERPHQSLCYKTPATVYKNAHGGAR